MALDLLGTFILTWLAEKALHKTLDKAMGINLGKLKDAARQMTPAFRRGLTLHKSQLVNMQKELDVINGALFNQRETRLIYIYGNGGVGKTRLIEESAKIARDPKNASFIYWGGIFDLYHADFHSVSLLQYTIANATDPKRQYFRKFLETQEKLGIRQSAGLRPTSSKEQEELDAEFIQSFNRLAASRRVCIAFDTLEKINDEIDPVQEIFQQGESLLSVKQWLIRFCKEVENTVVIMAGRPFPVLQQKLKQVFANTPGRVQFLPIDGLPLEHAKKLLEVFEKQKPNDALKLSENADFLWQHTNGIPAQLAMLTEISEEFMDVIQERQTETVSAEFVRGVVSAFFEGESEERRLLFMLALTRKGMNTDLLQDLTSWSHEECKRKLEALQSLSLVKCREGMEDIFLHDALYELFDLYVTREHRVDIWFKELKEYYQVSQIKSMNTDRAAWKHATINALYYGLRYDPVTTFKTHYIQWSEQAIRGFEIDLDLQMRDELLGYLNYQEQRDVDQTLSKPEIIRDSMLRWIKRYTSQGFYHQAARLAVSILGFGSETNIIAGLKSNKRRIKLENSDMEEALKSADTFFWGHLLACYGDALTYTGESEDNTTKVLHKAVKLIASVKFSHHDESLEWLRARLLGHAYDRLGYLSRLNGHYGRAISYYKLALPFYEKAQIDDEYASTLTNLSFALSLVGNSENANTYIDKALMIRTKIGKAFPIALSYNTRGLIQSMTDPESAVRNCNKALEKFEKMESRRGIGMACNALGYILRLQGNQRRKSNVEQARKCFEGASAFLLRAVKELEESEPSRVWESYNELGSLYSDWGQLLKGEEDTLGAKEKFSKSEEYQLLALSKTTKDMSVQKANSHDDLAVLYLRQGMISKAKSQIEKCANLVPGEYKNNHGKAKTLDGEAYWLVLGKMYFRRGYLKIQSSENSNVRDQERIVKEGIDDLIQSLFFYVKYWKRGHFLDIKAQEVANTIRQSNVSLNIIDQVVIKALRKNKLPASRLPGFKNRSAHE